MSRRVVLDTSTLVSAALRVGSVPHHALMLAFARCEVCVSAETIEELERVLDRGKFDQYLSRALRHDFVALVRRNSRLFAVAGGAGSIGEPTCRDSKDQKFLALALAAEAEVVVSSDEDLLVLHPWQGIAIVRPAEFLSELEPKSER